MMKIFADKKGVVEWIVLIVIVLIFIIAILTPFWGYGTQCRSNENCGLNSYCGSDYQCHQLKVIEKTIVEKQYTEPALIIAAAIIISIIILKLDLSKLGKLIKNKEEKEFMPPSNAFRADDIYYQSTPYFQNIPESGARNVK